MKIGTDIVRIDRIEASVEKFGARFLNRFLSEDEQKRLKHAPASLAGYWAAKEAISKALGYGIGRELGFHDVVLDHDTRGAPVFTLSPQAQGRFPIDESSLSISHDGGFAIAVVAITLTRQTVSQ